MQCKSCHYMSLRILMLLSLTVLTLTLNSIKTQILLKTLNNYKQKMKSTVTKTEKKRFDVFVLWLKKIPMYIYNGTVLFIAVLHLKEQTKNIGKFQQSSEHCHWATSRLKNCNISHTESGKDILHLIIQLLKKNFLRISK